MEDPLRAGRSALSRAVMLEQANHGRWNDRKYRPPIAGRRGWTAMAAILLVAAAALCCGLCAYGISRAVRRAREHHEAQLTAR